MVAIKIAMATARAIPKAPCTLSIERNVWPFSSSITMYGPNRGSTPAVNTFTIPS